MPDPLTLGKGMKKARFRVSQRRRNGRRELKSDRRLAAWLARTWANRSRTSTGGPPAKVGKHPQDWLSDLVRFLEKVALEGSGVRGQETPTKFATEREEAGLGPITSQWMQR